MKFLNPHVLLIGRQIIGFLRAEASNYWVQTLALTFPSEDKII